MADQRRSPRHAGPPDLQHCGVCCVSLCVLCLCVLARFAKPACLHFASRLFLHGRFLPSLTARQLPPRVKYGFSPAYTFGHAQQEGAHTHTHAYSRILHLPTLCDDSCDGTTAPKRACRSACVRATPRGSSTTPSRPCPLSSGCPRSSTLIGTGKGIKRGSMQGLVYEAASRQS